MKPAIMVAALLGLLLTVAGAVGAHVVSENLRGASGRWDGALLFGFVHVLAALVAAIAPLGRIRLAAAWAFIAGASLFSGLQIINIMWGPGSPLLAVSMLVPVGGVAFMVGWACLAVAALRST